MLWHVLDARSIWIKEFASSLESIVPVRSWIPEFRGLGFVRDEERMERIADPSLTAVHFPLQRGYSRFPLAQLLQPDRMIAQRLLRRSDDPLRSTLICTGPFYAPVAERWPGKIVYYLTDLTIKYDGVRPGQILRLDRRMCRVAHVVCPNSRRIADYLCSEAGCDPAKIAVIPNATRAENIAPRPIVLPEGPPDDIADLPLPRIGVIGNFAANIDWALLTEAIERTRDVSWVFAGPTDMPMPGLDQRLARRRLLERSRKPGSRIRFLGPKPYGQLRAYARSFDAALIPYAALEPTVSGSATRFYEHLAACRPIIASRAHHELRTKEPLLKLVASGADVTAEIERLRELGFHDGFEELRWQASREATWLVRARDLVSAAHIRFHRLVVAASAN